MNRFCSPCSPRVDPCYFYILCFFCYSINKATFTKITRFKKQQQKKWKIEFSVSASSMLFKVESGVNGTKSAWRDSQASPGSRHDERLLHETSTLVQDKSCPSHSKDIQAALMLSMMTHSLLSSGWDPVGTPCIPLHTLCRCLTYPGVPNSIKEPMLRKCLYTAFLLSSKLVVQFSG